MHSHNLRSMTGFGAAQRETPLGRFSVEIKSVNSRFLEISVNLSREIASLEYPLRNLIKGEIERGKVDCRVKFEPALDQEVQVRLNEPVIMQYLQILRGIREKARVPGEVTLDMILQLPGVAYPLEDNRDMEIFWKELEQVARTALAAYHQEREREGADLARHLMEEIAQLRASRAAVLPYKDQVTQRYREKLSARIAELEEQTKGKLDPGRLEMEVAMFADRADVSEELV
ncbi:hypothetical protein HY256_03530, partial [Candidatus Sumerlaeota bacterium]|nr:hypothetical protein [Candidatus Sumerlaeota bacterium]